MEFNVKLTPKPLSTLNSKPCVHRGFPNILTQKFNQLQIFFFLFGKEMDHSLLACYLHLHVTSSIWGKELINFPNLRMKLEFLSL